MKTRIQVQVRHKNTDVASDTSKTVHYDSTLDAIRKIANIEGLGGLYAGFQSSLIGVASTNFAYFYWYSLVRQVYASADISGQPPNTAIELSLGAMAGALAQVFTIPVSVITTRQQTAPQGLRKGLLETGTEIVKTEDGWTGLWRGLKASLILVINPAVTYGAYQRLRLVLFPNKSRLRPWESFILGALAKALATILTQPLIVAKVILQSRPTESREGRPFRTFLEVMRYVIEHEGPLALFKGLSAQLIKGVLVQGLLMMTKERSCKIDLLRYMD